MGTLVSAFTLLLVLGSSKAEEAEKIWTWEPLEALDLSTMEPTWDSKETNSRIFICRVKCSHANGDYDLGTYEHPPTNFKPENSCLFALPYKHGPTKDLTFMNVTDKSKIEILRYSQEKVEWTPFKRKEDLELLDRLRPRFVPLGDVEDNTYACRFQADIFKTGKNEAYIGYVGTAERLRYLCFAALHNGEQAVYVHNEYEVLLRAT